MKWYGEPERIDADHTLDCGVCDEKCVDCRERTADGGFVTPLYPESRGLELDELLNFAAIAANAAEHQLDPEEADAEFNAVLVDLDADDASFLVDLMFYQLTGPLLGGAPKSSPAHPPAPERRHWDDVPLEDAGADRGRICSDRPHRGAEDTQEPR